MSKQAFRDPGLMPRVIYQGDELVPAERLACCTHSEACHALYERINQPVSPEDFGDMLDVLSSLLGCGECECWSES